MFVPLKAKNNDCTFNPHDFTKIKCVSERISFTGDVKEKKKNKRKKKRKNYRKVC